MKGTTPTPVIVLQVRRLYCGLSVTVQCKKVSGGAPGCAIPPTSKSRIRSLDASGPEFLYEGLKTGDLIQNSAILSAVIDVK